MANSGHADLYASSESVSADGEEDLTSMGHAERELQRLTLLPFLPSNPPSPTSSSSPGSDPSQGRSHISAGLQIGRRMLEEDTGHTYGDDESLGGDDEEVDEESEESDAQEDDVSLGDFAHLQFEDGDFDEPQPVGDLQESDSCGHLI